MFISINDVYSHTFRDQQEDNEEHLWNDIYTVYSCAIVTYTLHKHRHFSL